MNVKDYWRKRVMTKKICPHCKNELDTADIRWRSNDKEQQEKTAMYYCSHCKKSS